jgi:hypothetical protein
MSVHTITIESPQTKLSLESMIIRRFLKNKCGESFIWDNPKIFDIPNMMVTKISPNDDTVTDTLFKDVTINEDDNGNINITSVTSEDVPGLFAFTCYLDDESDTLLELFETYDGDILASSNSSLLSFNRLEITDNQIKSENDLYVITVY